MLLASKSQEDPKKYAVCLNEDCAWWFFKPRTVTGAEKSGKCCLLQIAEALK